MAYERKTPPRLSVEISEEQDRKLRELIPHGQKRALFQSITDDVIQMLENSDNTLATIGAIINRGLEVK